MTPGTEDIARPGRAWWWLLAFSLVFVVGTVARTTSALEKDVSLSEATGSFLGEFEGDYLGYSLGGAADVNADGYNDLLIGAISNDQAGNNAGKAYVVLGRPGGWLVDAPVTDADASFVGEQEDDIAGIVASAGDVDGDGCDDVLVGAIGSHDSRGGAYLILGRESGWTPDESLSLADASFAGESAGDRAGNHVHGLGDVNGDGLDDFVIGARDNWNDWDSQGRVYLILGRTSGWTADQSLAGADASFDPGFDSKGKGIGLPAGDVDGDGREDFALWESYDEDGDAHDGTFSFLFLGQPGIDHDWDYQQADATFAAASCGSVGDVTGDGQVDLACQTPAGISDGQVYLFFDAPALLGTEVEMDAADASYLGEEEDDHAGRSLGTGDVDGDGMDDLLFQARHNGEAAIQAGQVYLVLGKASGWAPGTSLSEADASWHGEAQGDEAGRAAAIVGDVNADGFDDILIGAPDNSETALNAGQVYLIFGEPQPECPDDQDGDGYGDPGHADCPGGEETDCDDGDPAVHPGAVEDCDDGVDNDCDTQVDGDDPDCPEGDDDSADDDTGDDDGADDDSADDDDTTAPDDDDCVCRHAGARVGSAWVVLLSLVLLSAIRRHRS